jgi:multidrug transporter EmrE-like cation transporter
MNRTALLGLILTSVTLNASAQILLRWGARQGAALTGPPGISELAAIILRPTILGGFACYGFSLLVWLQVLSRADASFAYPFLGFGFALVALVGWCLLGEPMTVRRLAGTAIIMVGVIILASDHS